MFPTAAEIVSNLRKQFNSMEDVELTFGSWDLNRDGSISYSELKQAVAKTSAKLSEEEMNAIFVIGDIDQNGEIDLEEFKRLMMPTSSDVVAKFRSVHKTVHDVQQAFKKFDADGDGSIDRQELTRALNSSSTKFTQQEINVIFNAADVDKDGAVDYEEFIGLMCPSASDIVTKFRSQYRSIEDVRAAFKRFDADGDGSLSKDELAAAMKSSGQSYSNVEIDAIFSLGDVDGDGEITMTEFVALMSPSATEVLKKLRKNYKTINDVKKAFKAIDTDNDGLLSKTEMKNSAGNKFDNEEVNAIFELGDVNGDGELDMGEFIGLMFPSAAEVVYKLSANFKNINDVKDSFRMLDKDGDGSIDRDEMGSSGHKFSQEQIEAIFALGDVNDDGAIDIDEYIAVMCPSATVVISRIRQKFNNINDVKKAFLKIDVDRDGKISRKEMSNSQFNGQEIDSIFILGDINGDGELDLEEFIGLMCPAASEAVAKLSQTVKNVNEAQMLFRIMDQNGDGLLSMEEMRGCGQKFSQWELDALFAIGDINNDGEIDLNEFVAVICPAAETLVARISKNLGSLAEIKAVFAKMDKNKDGLISKEEMRVSGLNDQEVDAIFKLGDSNNDGEIDIDEFITVMCPSASSVVFKISKTFKSQECAMQAFKKMDANNDGKISKQEMTNAGLADGSKINHIEVDAIFALGDVDGDGEIDLEEFLAVMTPHAGISQTFSSSSNSQFMKTSSSSSSSFKQTSSSSASFQQKSSMSSSQSYSSTTTYSSTTVSVSFSNAGEVKQAFRKFDSDGDGHLDRNELKNLLIQTGKSVSDQEVDLLFKQGDVDGDGKIDIQEFIKLMFPAANATLSKLQQSFNSLNDVKAAFRKYDADGDGHIVRSELRQVMSSFSDSEVDSIFALGDKDQSGGIDYQEFIGLMIPNSTSILSNIASQFSSVQKIKEGFKMIDANGDGAISRNELRSGMRLGDEQLDVIFAIGDIDQDGEISMSEFIRLMSPSASSGMNSLRNSFRNISEVIAAFKKFDANNDGALSQQELLNGINSIGLQLSQQECSGIFGMADINQDGEINYIEFVSALFPAAADGLARFRSRLGAITDVKVAFKRFDADGDGSISINELAKGAGNGFSAGEISAVFALGDSDQDGSIDFAEFAQLVLPSARDKVGQIRKSFNSANAIEQAFQKFDVNKDGKISCDELAQGLRSCGMKFNDQEVMTVFAIADLDGDGEICIDEFKTLLGCGGSSTQSSSKPISFKSINDVKIAFRRFDVNSDGHLDRNEFRQMLKATGNSDAESDLLFKQADVDGDGKVDYQELVKHLFPASAQALQKVQKSFRNLDEVKVAFRKFDADGDGHINKDELKKVLSGFSSEEIESIFALGDKDQSGGIDIQEFIGLMLPSAPSTIAKLAASFRSITNIRESFKKFDKNNDGQICRQELKTGMKLSDADLDIVFALGDLDGDGEISMSEFVRVMSPLAANAVNRFRNCFSSINDLVSVFKKIDTNNDGSISIQELSAGMRELRMSFSNEETNAIFAAADINQDGDISYIEFVSLMIPSAGDALVKFRKQFKNIQNAKNDFNKFDADGDEEITFEELARGMGSSYSENEVKAVFSLGDSDQDGKISFLEFAKLMIPAASEALVKFWKCFRDMKGIRQAFKQFDADGDGEISRSEVMSGMKRSGRNFTDEEIDALFILADRDNNGQIDFPEFALIMIPSAPERIAKLRRVYKTQAEVTAAFKKFDTNNDGAIDYKEMMNGLKKSGVCMTEQEMETIFGLADLDGDGEVSTAEFVQLLCPGASPVSSGSGKIIRFRNIFLQGSISISIIISITKEKKLSILTELLFL